MFLSDILISDGKIKSVGKKIAGTKFKGKIIDATGLFVLPGGIDPHVHMQLPVGDTISSDDFESGSIAAIAGGTTTIIDFVTPSRDEDILLALKSRKEEAKRSYCDYGLHMSIVSLNKGVDDRIKKLVTDEGIISFKLYMAYKNSVGMDDKDILNAMEIVGNAGGIAMIHCEVGDAAEFLQNKYLSKGKSSIKYYPEVRNDKVESDAVGRAIFFSEITGCPLYIVHLSSESSLKKVYSAREKGVKIISETCPHYLLLDDSLYKDSEKGKKFLMCPPLRGKSDNTSLWNAVTKGLIDVVSTDHCPFKGKGETGSYSDDFSVIPKGIGGVEYRLKLLYTYGVSTGKIGLNRFVDLISARPAKIFGLYPRKGTIMPGSDADIVLWDPEKSEKISVKDQYQNCDTNVYEDFEIKGAPSLVMIGGRIIFENDLFDLSEKRGNYLFRKR